MTLQRELPDFSPEISQTKALAATGLGLAALALVAAFIGGRITRSEDVDGFGLLFALPAIYWIGVGLAVVASALLLYVSAADYRKLGAVVPGLWIAVLHTAPALAHDFARFPIVYIHLGFIRVIDDTAASDVLIDARFAWPGFFGSFISSLAELDPTILDWVMRLWPTLIIAASAVLVAALARRSYPNRPLIGPMSSLVFVLISWTGQDYFSPQSVGFFFYLSIIVVLESGPLRPRGSWSSLAPILSRFATAGGDRPEGRSTASYVALLILSYGAVVSHPLAPFFICAALVVLGLYGRRVAWRLLIMVTAGYLLWVLVAAEPWWSTRIEELTGQFGSFLSNFQSSTSDRVATSSPSHLFVTGIRAWMGLVTFLSALVLGITMATDRFRYLRPALPLAPLAGIPVLAAALQSYGGEIIIRVLLFTLPMASILVARLLLVLPIKLLPIIVPVLTVAVVPPFLVARFGNEAFEMVTAVDRHAVEVMYEAADDDTLLMADNSFLPWADQRRGTNEHLYSRAEPTTAWIDSVMAELVDSGHDRVVIIFTPSQSAYRQHVENQSPGSLDQIGQWVATQPGIEVLVESEGAWVFAMNVGRSLP